MKKFLFAAALSWSLVTDANAKLEKAVPGGNIIDIQPTAYDPIGAYVPTDDALDKYFSTSIAPNNFTARKSGDVFRCEKSDASAILNVLSPNIRQNDPITLAVGVDEKAYIKSFLTGEWGALLQKSAQTQRYVLRLHIPRLTSIKAETVAFEISPLNAASHLFIGSGDHLVSLRERKRFIFAIQKLEFSLSRAPLFVDQSGGRYLVDNPRNLEEVLIHIETNRPQDLVKLQIVSLDQPKDLYFVSSPNKMLVFVPTVLSNSRISERLTDMGCEKRTKQITVIDLKTGKESKNSKPWERKLAGSVTASPFYSFERLELGALEHPELSHLFGANRLVAEADETSFQGSANLQKSKTPIQVNLNQVNLNQVNWLVHSVASFLGVIIGLIIPKLSRRKHAVFVGGGLCLAIMLSLNVIPKYVAAPLVELMVFTLATSILRKNFHE